VSKLADTLRELGGDVHPALEKIALPVFVADASGTLVYLNPAAASYFGEVAGKKFASVVAPESLRTAERRFARKLLGAVVAEEGELRLLDKHRRIIHAEVSSVALGAERGHVVGIFGLVELGEIESTIVGSRAVRLTPRQAEVLRQLAAGRTTPQMAASMGVEVHTVRNHVRDLLRRLGTHSRLEAVVRAQELGLLG
jgi:PAS domain S-box-containing protein